ncbi:hypothetical protein Hsero_1823 [Herbaspirillum seropedicae SmR1]|uniref:Uncharacterized protein n=1 Tax=Herbaspirillum seropedicae (strain SmR1) TaxID=757424 RepID=D8IRK9_HERSS|nr:hypothetical protein Hsero_1823 [Herbaspirillum seropedicae SmR1]
MLRILMPAYHPMAPFGLRWTAAVQVGVRLLLAACLPKTAFVLIMSCSSSVSLLGTFHEDERAASMPNNLADKTLSARIGGEAQRCSDFS